MNIYEIGLTCGTSKRIKAESIGIDAQDNTMLFIVNDKPKFYLASGRWDYVDTVKENVEEGEDNGDEKTIK